MRSKILTILKDDRWHSFDELLVDIVKTTLNDPYLNASSVRMCLEMKDYLRKELQEIYRDGLIQCMGDEFRKIK
jgi:hypothetical protein